jgi:hypothetical protein
MLRSPNLLKFKVDNELLPKSPFSVLVMLKYISNAEFWFLPVDLKLISLFYLSVADINLLPFYYTFFVAKYFIIS